MNNRNLLQQQLNSKMQSVASLQKIVMPPIGWIKAIRMALGMSARQLGDKLRITRQGVQDMENREQQGTITLKALRETANALDMQLVYGFVPIDGSLDALIDRKARALATQIVLRTAQSMLLEDQGNTRERLEKAIEEQVAIYRKELPKVLWD